MQRWVILACTLMTPALMWAQAADQSQDRLKSLEERVRQLEAEVQTLKAALEAVAPAATAAQPSAPAAPSAVPPTTVPVPAGAPGTPSGALPVYGGASALAKVLNPDISAIGDFIGGVGHNPVRPIPALQMHESEAGFQAIIDPYARGDFFISFGEHGVDLEEGYITFTSLPAGFVAKVGKMRSSFGVVNTLHNHVLPWIDRPQVTDSLVGGEDGITDAGFSITRLIPAPKGLFLEGTGQVFRGDSGDVFQSSRSRDVSLVGHLRAYHDLTESSNVDMGFSYARGHNDAGSNFITQLYGTDFTFRWKPLRRAIYHSFASRTELVWSNRRQLLAVQRAFGFYTSAEYRLNRRWTAGGRYDRSDRAREANLTDSGFSAVLTYWPSEFSQVRGQYRLTEDPFGKRGHELLFQFMFSLGAHGAHPF